MEPRAKRDGYPGTQTARERLRHTMESIRGRESNAEGEVTRIGEAVRAIADATREAGLECERFTRTREGLASAMSARGTGVRLRINAAHECRSDESPYPRTNPGNEGRNATITVAEWALELRCDETLVHAERVRIDIEAASGDVRVEVIEREGRKRRGRERIRTDLSEHKGGTAVEGAQDVLEEWMAGHINRVADTIDAVDKAQAQRESAISKTTQWSVRPGVRGWRLIAIGGWMACAAVMANTKWDTAPGENRGTGNTATQSVCEKTPDR